MVKAQDWLNETFPTQESREKVKVLAIVKGDAWPYKSFEQLNVGGEEVKFKITRDEQDIYYHQNLITGKLDLSDFINLEKFLVSEQSVTEIKLNNCQKLNNLCQLQKELTYLEQQQNQIVETKIIQVELPKF